MPRKGQRGHYENGRFVEHWFPKDRVHTGWHKTQSPAVRRQKLLDSTPRTMTLDHRRLQAQRRAQALANINKDRGTKRKALSDARYFSRIRMGS